MTSTREHVISVVLSDAEWKAFVQTHPQPVAWLRERILEENRRQQSTASSQAVA